MCAILNTGDINCWGNNSNGKLGNNSFENSIEPVSVSNISNATQITLGLEHSCALISNGSVKCWGSNTNSILGKDYISSSRVPVEVYSSLYN